MVKITFMYRDQYCKKDEWNIQQCTVKDREECIKIYGLESDPNCEYQIISEEEVKET